MNLQDLVRPHIRTLSPYTSARDEYAGQVGTFLDANENPLGSAIEGGHNRYPDPHHRELKARLAELKGVAANQIFLGNGSDEAIDLLFRAFCEPKRDHVIICPPTYGMYQVSADLNQVKTVPVPLTDDFRLNSSELMVALKPGSKLIFLCSPNNPTANSLDPQAIRRVLEKAPGLVVVDEAYIDFAPEKTLLPWLEQFPHLVVLQTFSKAWGLARLRLGAAYAHPEVIAVLDKIKPPYNVNGLTQELALQALAEPGRKDEMVAEILAQRALLEAALPEVPGVTEVFPSDANFLLVRMTAAQATYDALIERQIIVRNRSRVVLCEGCLRITVGTAEENEKLLAALREIEA